MSSFPDDLPRVEPSPLAPPPGSFDEVRRRARTRRQRRGAALGGGLAAALVLGVVGGAALSSTGGQQTDSLVATAPSAGPTSSSTPAPVPSGPTASPLPAAPAPGPPTGVPSAPATPAPEDAPPPEAVLLEAAEVQTVGGGGWTSQGDAEAPFPLLMACPEGTPAPEGVLRSFTREERLLQQQLLRYADASAARAALDRLVGEVRRCPTRAADSDDGQASVDHALRSATPERAAVVETSRDCDTCPERQYQLLVAVVDRTVVLLRSDDADLPLPELLDAATR